jgi:hypothetical protein
MPVPVYSVGQVLGAADCNTWFTQLAAYKPADGSAFTSNTTLANDPDIVIALAASSVYRVTSCLFYTAGSGGLLGGLKWTFTGPSGIQGRYSPQGTGNGNVLGTVSLQWTDTGLADGLGTGTVAAVSIQGILQTFGAAGNLQLQVAQANSNATATTLKVRTFLEARRIS